MESFDHKHVDRVIDCRVRFDFFE